MTDAPQILLAHHLKKLRLPTFLSEHDKLARACAAEGKDHVQYLLRFVNAGVIFPKSAEVKFPTFAVFGCQPFSVTCGSILWWTAAALWRGWRSDGCVCAGMLWDQV